MIISELGFCLTSALPKMFVFLVQLVSVKHTPGCTTSSSRCFVTRRFMWNHPLPSSLLGRRDRGDTVSQVHEVHDDASRKLRCPPTETGWGMQAACRFIFNYENLLHWSAIMHKLLVRAARKTVIYFLFLNVILLVFTRIWLNYNIFVVNFWSH